jgi:hypothetical protein
VPDTASLDRRRHRGIYCLLKGPAYPFVFPFDQWMMVAAPWWQHDPWTTVCVAAGAAAPE